MVNSSQGGGTKRHLGGRRLMLSRTADNMYWLSRYVERAENIARIMEVAGRLSNLPSAYAGASNEWESALIASGCSEGFKATGVPASDPAIITTSPSPSRTRPRSRAASRPRAPTPAPCAPRSPSSWGSDQRRLARTPAAREGQELRPRPAALPRRGEGDLAGSTGRPTARCCATTAIRSPASASTWSARTTPRASST